MAEKLKIPYPIVVEGKYDKIRLTSLVDAQVLTTGGFAIFNSSEVLGVLRALSAKSPLIVLTDSDGAGTLIRSAIKRAIPADRLIQLYIPKIPGKERRKIVPSAEGVLGVEGMDNDVLLGLLRPYAVGSGSLAPYFENPLSKVDFYTDGLTGAENSSQRRDALAAMFSLPPGMTPNALLAALRMLCTYDEYLALVGRR